MTFEPLLKDLKELYPYPEFEFESRVYARDKARRNVYRVMVLFLLSTGANDKILKDVCHNLFNRYPKPENLVGSDNTDELIQIIKPIGKYNKSLEYIKSAAAYCLRSGSDTHEICIKIKEDPADLTSRVRGIGPKLSECIKAYDCGEPGLPVDSNVMRVVYRVGADDETEPNYKFYGAVRSELKSDFKPAEWIDVHEILRLHGQAVCRKASPECRICPVKICLSREAEFTRKAGITIARQKAKEIINDEWNPWRELICDPM